MRILLHAWGSRGDVQPVLALGMRLRERGHEVTVAATRDFGDWILAQGVGFEPFGMDLGELSQTPLGRAWLGGQAANQRHELAHLHDFLALSAEPIAATLVRTNDAFDGVANGKIPEGGPNDATMKFCRRCRVVPT